VFFIDKNGSLKRNKTAIFWPPPQSNKGYMVVMRVAPRSLSEVVNAVQSSVSSVAAHGGYCMGFAEPAYVSREHFSQNSYVEPVCGIWLVSMFGQWNERLSIQSSVCLSFEV